MKTNQEVVMKFLTMIQAVLILTILPHLGIFAQVVEDNAADKTLSPFFFVQSDDPDLDQLPLKSTSADVNIAGVIADVKVVQVYKNEGKSVLEAIYIFPASTRAAVYDMKMMIGERTIRAKIKERKEAREKYEQAVKEGRTASLLEQQRPNVFQMTVGNILPGDEIKVELRYTELLISEEKTYEFMYPTVVGPRYSNQSEDEAGADKWVKNPYLQEGQEPTYNFKIDVHIAAGMPIKDIFSPSHEVNIDYQSADEASINLAQGEYKKGDRDYILKYRLNGDQVAPGLLLHRGEKENFFLMMLQPPKRVKTNQIPNREYIFIVDVSGSMNGFPLDISKELLRDLIGNLQKNDRFNVLLFAAGSNIMAKKSLPATEENISKAIHIIERERGGGGTELLPALKRALSLPKTEGYSRTVVIATDGYVHVEKEAFDLIRNNLGKANMFPFGIGSSVNRFLIEGMARAGMGESFVITRPADAKKTATKFRKYISSPVLTNIHYKIDGFDVYDVEPRAIPDVFAERPVLLFGKWRGNPKGKIKINGIAGQGKEYSKTIDVSDYKTASRNQALTYLWARYKISLLSDYNQVNPDDETVKEITSLGLTYSLLTAYTSFIAADTQVRNESGQVTTVQQPLPLPHGVSNMALAMRSAAGSGMHKTMSGGPGYSSPRLEKAMLAEDEEVKQEITVEINADFNSKDLKKHNSDFEKIIKNQNNLFEYCYLKSKLNGLEGEIKIEVILNTKSQIIKLKVLENSLNDKTIEKCLVNKIKALKLVTPDRNKNVTFVLEISFES
jgi:Ca-activated chloride channel family protein